MSHEYSEAQLIEQPAVNLFASLNWHTMSAREEIFGSGGTLGRETEGDVVLVARLQLALARLNPALPPEALTAAVVELTRDRSAVSLAVANREVYGLLRDGVPVSLRERERGGQRTARVQVIEETRLTGKASVR